MKRNRILYLILFLASLLFIYFYGGKVPYMLFYVVVLLPFVSLFYITVIFFRFKYTQHIDKKFAMKGEKVNFIFSVHNEDLFLYPYIHVTFCGAKTIFARQFQTKSFSLVPFKERKFYFELECKYRGVYDIGIESVEIEDLLGIFRLRYKVFEPRYITVYPRIVQLDRFNIKTNFISESHTIPNSRFEDMTTISDIRNYSLGDNIKKIHWKLTAKMGNLMVKNFQSTSETNATIILDLKRNNFSFEENTIIEDKVIESAVSVIFYCLSNWIHTNIIFFKEKIVNIEAKNPLDFDEVYRILSGVSFKEKVDVKDILDIYLQDNIRQNNLFVFTSNINYNLYNQLHKSKFSGCEVSLVYISPEDITGVCDTDSENILKFLPEIDVDVYKINITDDLKAVLER